eukprot:12019122-Alexandrium_andersonii.AAC.1
MGERAHEREECRGCRGGETGRKSEGAAIEWQVDRDRGNPHRVFPHERCLLQQAVVAVTPVGTARPRGKQGPRASLLQRSVKTAS